MLSPSQPPSESRNWLLVAAAVVAVAGLGALVLLTTSADDPLDELDRPVPSAPPVTIGGDVDEQQPPSSVPTESIPDRSAEVDTTTREQAAVEIAERYFTALSTNDPTTVLELSDPALVDAAAETDLVRWWWLTAWPDAEPSVWPSQPCAVSNADGDGIGDGDVSVTCPVTVADPVAAAVGLDELAWSVAVGDDGVVRRDPAPVARDGASYESVWRAYSGYLATYRNEEYAVSCDPAAAPESSSTADGLTFNGRCAQSVSGVSDVVALWVLAGGAGPGVVDAGALAGYWVNTGGFDGLFVDFRTDGTFTIGNTGELGDAAFASGTYEADAGIIRFTVSPTSNDCGGESWSWEIGAPLDGLLEVDTVANGGCAPDAHWLWTRVSPASPGSLRLGVGPEGAVDRRPAPIVPGIWLRLGTSEVLAIAPDRSYFLTRAGDTLAPVDTGAVVEIESGRWVFTSAGGGDCEAGSIWTWEDVTMPDGALDRGSTIDVSVAAPATPTCGGDDTKTDWLLLSPDVND